jgi:hypothetical protein
MRAVDDASTAYPIAADRVAANGWLVALEAENSAAGAALMSAGFAQTFNWRLPDSETVLRVYRRTPC